MSGFEDDEHAVEDALEKRCAECGATLTAAEIHAARETAGPFLCTVHAAEALAVADDGPDLPPAA